MKWFLIENDSEMPIEALEMLGGTDKPAGQGYIGKFGTGSKYAIAAALRNQIDVRMCIGEKKIQFGTKATELSRSSVFRITTKIDNNTPKDRDWTTSMGVSDWMTKPSNNLTVEWMIVREFYSNAIDESDKVFISIADRILPEKGKTKFYIRYSDTLKEIFDNFHLYFPRCSKKKRDIIEENQYGRVYPMSRDKGAIYCQGVFVCSLHQNLLFDYDFNFIQLTESRTVEPWYFASALANLVKSSSPAFVAKFLKKMHDNGEKCFEYSIDGYHLSNFEKSSIADGFRLAFGEEAFLSPHQLAASTADQLSRIDRPRIVLKDSWRNAISSSGIVDYTDVIDKDILHGYRYIPKEEIDLRIDHDFLKMVYQSFDLMCDYFQLDQKPELRFFTWEGSAAMPLGNCSNNKIGINITIPRDYKTILSILAEEFAHYVSKAADLSRELVKCLTDQIGKNLSKEMG